MRKLPISYKETLTASIGAVLWKQWSALGVASYLPPTRKWLIDPEALLVATIMFKDGDKRLFEAALNWTAEHKRFLSMPRYKRIRGYLLRTLRKFGLSVVLENGNLPDISNFNANTADRGGKILIAPNLKFPVLFRLKLRNIFGTNARPEVMLFFIYHQTGTSLSIAKEIFLEQKSVYTVIREWVEAGILERKGGPKSGYFMRPALKKKWLHAFDISEIPDYLNWGRTFTPLIALYVAMEKEPWSSDEYLLSSLLRDMFPILSELWAISEFRPPEPSLYPGGSFVPVFFDALEKVLNIIAQ